MEEELLGHRQTPLLVPILYESDEEMLQARTVREIQIASNFAVLKSSASTRKNDAAMPSAKRMKAATNDKSQQQYDLAVETAILVHKEIEQWENSIRELEIMLSTQEQQQHQQHRFQSTSDLVHVADSSVAHESIDTVALKNNAPIIPNRSVSVSSTESRVAVIDEEDVAVVDEDDLHAPVVWEGISSSASLPALEIITASLSSASSSST
jgi:hypothetical protein